MVAEDEGVGVFTSLPVVGASTAYAPYADNYHSARAVVRLAVSVGGRTLQVFGTHLQGVVAARNASMPWLRNWASNFWYTNKIIFVWMACMRTLILKHRPIHLKSVRTCCGK